MFSNQFGQVSVDCVPYLAFISDRLQCCRWKVHTDDELDLDLDTLTLVCLASARTLSNHAAWTDADAGID